MSRRRILRPLALAFTLVGAAPRPASAQDGLPQPLGRWSFDLCESVYTWDEAATPHHGRLGDGTVCGEGRYGGGAIFNGAVDARVEVPGSSAFDAPTFTIAAWVKPSGAGAVMNRWYFPDSWGLWYVGGKFLFGVSFPNGGTGATVAIDAPAPSGEWTHVAASYSGSQVRLYLNGAQAAAAPASGVPQATTRPIVIGNHPTWEAFEGTIDEARFYGQALTASEVYTLATTAPPPGLQLPVAYEAESPWNFLSGGAVVDKQACPGCSGGAVVRNIGHGGALSFTGVLAPTAGYYLVDVAWSGPDREAWVNVNARPPSLVSFVRGKPTNPKVRRLRVKLDKGHNDIGFANPSGPAPDIDFIRLSEGAIDRVFLDADVPMTGEAVVGSAATHEHVASERAFSGKWFWGSVDGPEDVSMRSCDGSGDTHAGAFGICTVGGAGDIFGPDTCCHAGGVLDCAAKHTDGHTGDPERDYLEWPKWDTNAHPRYWHGYLRRALERGMKLIVAHAVENYPLCSVVKSGVSYNTFRQQGFDCDMADSGPSIERQINFLEQFAANHSDFLEIAYTAADARRIIGENKMAMVIGVEADYAWAPDANPLERLEAYHNLGARTVFLAHSLNTQVAGTALYLPVFAAQQSFLNCFLHGVQCGTNPDNPFEVDPNNPRSVDQTDLFGCWPEHADAYDDLCQLKLAGRLLNPDAWDGFKRYPGGGVHFEVDTRFGGATTSVKMNDLGLSDKGVTIVERMMDKGMLLEIGHVSEHTVVDLYGLSSAHYGYPLVASHVYARGISSDDSATWEGKLGDQTLHMIAETEGFAGHFTGGDVALDYPNSGVDNACSLSTRSLAQSVAYAADRTGLRVAWAGDFQGFGRGVAPRLGYTATGKEWCDGNYLEQCLQVHDDPSACAQCSPTEFRMSCPTEPMDSNLTHYGTPDEKDRAYFHTRGYAHHGLIAQLHADLEHVGLRPHYLNALRDRSAETVIRTWEKSEYIATLPKPLR